MDTHTGYKPMRLPDRTALVPPVMAPDHEPAYVVQYSAGAYNTDTLLTLTHNGVVIQQRDPFHPRGIPTSKGAARKRISIVASEMVKEAMAANGEATDTRIRYRLLTPARL